MKYLQTLVLLFFGLSAFSIGPVDIGIKLGSNSSTMITDFDLVLTQNIQEDNINNYFVGAFARINVGRIYAQPEIYFNTKGGIITPIGINEFQIPTQTTFDYQTIDVPVLLGFKVLNRNLVNLRLFIGPVFSYVTANSLKSEITNLKLDDFKDNYMGWQMGAGVDIWFLTFDASIENSSNVLSTNSLFEAKNRTYLLSVGMKIF